MSIASLEHETQGRTRGLAVRVRLRLEEWTALGAFAILLALKARFGGGIRLLTYFTVRGLWLFVAVALLFLVAAVRHGRPRGARVTAAEVTRHALGFVRDFMPFVALIVIYENLLPLIGRMRPVLYDGLALRIDLLLFGTTPARWLVPLATRARTEWFAFFYLGLFALPVVSGGLLYLAGRRREFREFMLAFTLAGLIGFVGYVLVPIVGPRYYFPKQLGAPSAALLETSFAALATHANELHVGFGRARNCFPSLHTAWGLIVLVFAYRQMRWLFFVYLLPVGSLLVATVYLRFHYAVDLIAGALVALLLCAAAPRLARRFPVNAASDVPTLALEPALAALSARISRHAVAHWPYLGLLLVVGPVYLSSLPTGITTHGRGEDGAELVAAAITGGTAHPPGYPLYTILLRAACALFPHAPPIDVAHTLSAVVALLAGAVVVSLGRAWFRALASEQQPGLAELGAWVSGVTFCFSPALFRQALIAEVYALHALTVACLARVATHLVLSEAPLRRRDVALFGVTGGLAVTHHLTAGPLLFALAVALICLAKVRALGAKGLVAAALGFGLGCLPWAYLPWAAAKHPALSWGQPDTWSRFVWVVSAQQYHSRFGGHASSWLAHLKAQFPLWRSPALVLAFATAGVFAPIVASRALSTRARQVAVLLGALVVANVASALPYSIGDLESYFIPSELGCAAFTGLGFVVVARTLGTLGPLRGRGEGLAAVVAAVLLSAGLGFSIRRADAHGQSHLDRRVREVVGRAEPGALIAARGDGMVFGLWYEKLVRNARPDLDIVSRELLLQPWYASNASHFTAGMRWPSSPLRGTAQQRLSAVIRANYGRRPVVVVDPADVPAGCVRAPNGVLSCEPRPEPEARR
jgi:hypothetical protein